MLLPSGAPALRILFYTGNYYPEKTGIGKYSGELAQWLADRGHQVDVITGYPYYPEWKLDAAYQSSWHYRTERSPNLQVTRIPHYIPATHRLSSLRRMLVDLSMVVFAAWPFLKSLLRRLTYDVVIVTSPPLLLGFWPMLYGRLRGVPWVLHVQDYQLDAAMQLGMVRQGIVGRLLAYAEKALITSATRVTSISRSMCDRASIKGADPRRVELFPNWSDLTAIAPLADFNPVREQLTSMSEDFVVMYAGSMGNKQGLEIVLEAAHRLRAERSIRFLMVGAGAALEALKAEQQKLGLTNLVFWPPQPVEALNQLLCAADVHLVIQKASAADLVMPSKLTNIMASGRPAIVTAEKGTELERVVSEAGAGLVIAPEDPGALENAILECAWKADRGRQMGEQARRYAEKTLDKQLILRSFESLLIKIARSGRAGVTT